MIICECRNRWSWDDKHAKNTLGLSFLTKFNLSAFALQNGTRKVARGLLVRTYKLKVVNISAI